MRILAYFTDVTPQGEKETLAEGILGVVGAHLRQIHWMWRFAESHEI